MSRKKALRILLVDDHPMIRQGLLRLLGKEPDVDTCGEAGAGREALELAARLKPHLALVDLALPDMDGIDLIKDLRARHPRLLILVLSMRDESLYAERALRAGAAGYIMKGQRPRKVMEAVRRVLSGEVYLSEAMASRLMRRLLQKEAAAAPPIGSLSDRELQVFTMIGEGLGPSKIAEHLHLSVKTIETYRANIKRKLDLPDAAALRCYAIQWAHRQKAT